MVAQSEVRCGELAVVPELANAATVGAYGMLAWAGASLVAATTHLVLISAAIFTATVKHSFHLLPHLLL
jgi:hypothetical protein